MTIHSDRRMEGFREHIAIDGSFRGMSGRDAACGLCGTVRLRHGSGAVVYNPLYDAGGVGSAEKDEKSSGMCFHHGRLQA